MSNTDNHLEKSDLPLSTVSLYKWFGKVFLKNFKYMCSIWLHNFARAGLFLDYQCDLRDMMRKQLHTRTARRRLTLNTIFLYLFFITTHFHIGHAHKITDWVSLERSFLVEALGHQYLNINNFIWLVKFSVLAADFSTSLTILQPCTIVTFKYII